MRQTVLIVDDHGDFRAAARELLEADGYEVIGEAADGAGALHKVDELRPAIVLLDIQLPDSDGFEVAARLASRPSPPIVVLISSRDAGCVRRSGGARERPRLHLEGAPVRRLARGGRRLTRSMPRGAYLLLPIGIAFGIWSEWVAYGPGQPRVWLPDLLAGMTILGAGMVAWARRPASRVGPLLALTAMCWFAGNLAKPLLTAAWPTALVAPALAEALLASHRAPFAHALMGFPTGRLATPVERVGVWVAYASVVLSIWSFGSGALIIAAVAASATFVAYRQTSGRRRRAKLLALQVAAAMAVAVAGGLALRYVLGAEPALLLYELAVGGSAVLLAAGLARPETEEAKVADIVVELGEVRSGTLRDALAGILGDPSLEIAYRVATADAYVDASGRPVDLPEPSQGRAITRIERDGEVVAVLVHDPSVLDDPALVDAVASATRLASRNAELQAEIQGPGGRAPGIASTPPGRRRRGAATTRTTPERWRGAPAGRAVRFARLDGTRWSIARSRAVSG